jgi:hypothetical protein
MLKLKFWAQSLRNNATIIIAYFYYFPPYYHILLTVIKTDFRLAKRRQHICADATYKLNWHGKVFSIC